MKTTGLIKLALLRLSPYFCIVTIMLQLFETSLPKPSHLINIVCISVLIFIVYGHFLVGCKKWTKIVYITILTISIFYTGTKYAFGYL